MLLHLKDCQKNVPKRHFVVYYIREVVVIVCLKVKRGTS